MTVSVNTLIERSVRNMGAVDSHVKNLAIELIKKAYQEGIRVQISSGYRSPKEQARLYAQGRTAAGNIVTNAEPGESVHNYGLAIDYFLVSEDGNDAIWTVNSDWRRVAAIGKSLGFSWGGDWHSFKDYAHLEYTQGHTWHDLKAGWRPDFGGGHPSNSGLIRLGSKGAAVVDLQKALMQAGYNLSPYGADGDFGDVTEKALKQFQADHDLVVDGIYGPKSKAAMEKALQPKPAGSAIVPFPGLLKKGSRGHEVERVQRALGITVDGIFGSKTEAAVRAYQRRHGLTVDGLVGEHTWSTLF